MIETSLHLENQQPERGIAEDMLPASPFLGRTVLQSLAEASTLNTSPVLQPDQTPPVPFQTNTRSGNGLAQLTDDQDSEHLYE